MVIFIGYITWVVKVLLVFSCGGYIILPYGFFLGRFISLVNLIAVHNVAYIVVGVPGLRLLWVGDAMFNAKAGIYLVFLLTGGVFYCLCL